MHAGLRPARAAIIAIPANQPSQPDNRMTVISHVQTQVEQSVEAHSGDLATDRAFRPGSEDRLRLVIEATSDGVWDWNLQTGEMFFSDRWYTMLDYAPGEFAAGYAVWRERVHPDDIDAAEATVQAHLDGHLPEFSIEFRMQAKNGDWRWINSRGKVIVYDAIGKPLRMVGTNVDIHARKQAESALRLAQLSIQRASDAVFWITPGGRFIEVNDQACHSLGYSRDEMLSMAVWDIDPNFSPEDWPPHWQRTRQLGKRLFETRHRRRDGTIFPVEVTANAVEYDGGQYDFAFVRDMTERKRVEADLQRHREHLEDLVNERTAALARTNVELHQAMAQLVESEKLAALGHLVAGVAHELNTPLGNARMVASTLGEQLREFALAVESGSLRRSQLEAFLSRSREAVNLLERNTARAADLIGHFKQVAVDQSTVRRRSFDLRQTVEEVLTTLQPMFKRSRHQIAVDIAPGLELDSYPGPLEQIIANLIGNSLTHGFTGIETGLIELKADATDTRQIVLRYADNGIGMSAATLKRIFEPFFTTRLGQGSSGLGLYIVYNLVTGVLGGTIHVDSSLDRGARFTLTLPLSAPDHQVMT